MVVMTGEAGRFVKIMPGPVIIITGTPGTGKTTHAQLLAEMSTVPLEHINVGEWVKERGLHEGFDSEWQAYTVDEDKVRSSPAH
jgi:adenylate kinase